MSSREKNRHVKLFYAPICRIASIFAQRRLFNHRYRISDRILIAIIGTYYRHVRKYLAYALPRTCIRARTISFKKSPTDNDSRGLDISIARKSLAKRPALASLHTYSLTTKNGFSNVIPRVTPPLNLKPERPVSPQRRPRGSHRRGTIARSLVHRWDVPSFDWSRSLRSRTTAHLSISRARITAVRNNRLSLTRVRYRLLRPRLVVS